MRFLRLLLPVLVLGVVVFAPYAAFAAETNALGEGWHLLPVQCECPGSAPDFACVGYVIQRLMDLAFSIGVVIFVLVTAYAGVLFMATSVNPHGKEQAKSMLTNAVIGLLLA